MPTKPALETSKVNHPLKVALISTFGPNIRGLSPYSDGLADELEKNSKIQLIRIDYEKIFPSLLYPASGNQQANNPYALLHYAKPSTWKKVFDSQPDLIHIQYWTPVTALILLSILKIAKQKNIPSVITVHNTSSHESLPFFSTLEGKLYNYAEGIICHTRQGAKSLIKRHPQTAKKVTVIAHGVWLKEREHALPPQPSDYQITGLCPTKNYLLYFGNIRHYKGVDLLLSAWGKIAKDHPNTQLIIAGRTWEGSNIFSSMAGKLLGNAKTAQQIKQQALNGIPIQTTYKLGFVEDNVLDSLLKISSMAIFPYRKFDAQSGAASRAASIGTPIIVTNKGGLPDLVIDESFICKTLDPEHLGNIIHEKLLSISAADRESQVSSVSNLKWENIAEKHVATYLDMTSNDQ